MVVKQTKFNKPQSELDKQLIELSARSLEEKNQTNLANSIRQNATNFSDVVEFFAQTGNTNTLAGNLFGFIAKQFVKSYDFKELYGDLFVEGEPIEAGSGFSYVETINNMVGISAPINYQTSTQAAGTIAFGESFSNGYFINLTTSNIPFQNIDSTFQTWVTINITIPNTFTSFSSLSPIKANEILNLYEKNLANSRKFYYYYLGNQLFNYFIKNNYFSNTFNCNNQGVSNVGGWSPGYSYTAPTNLMEALQNEIIPLLEYMRQPRYYFNLGFSWSSNQTAGVVSTVNYLDEQGSQIDQFNMSNQMPWITYNSQNGLIPNLKASNLDDLVIICSVKVSASLKTLLASNYLGMEKIDAEFNGNRLTRLCGVKVVVAGSNLQLPNQVSQGSTQNTGTLGTPLIDDNTIIVMEKDALVYHKFYDEYYETNTLVASMVKLGRWQIGYLPFLNQWKQGCILKFNEGVLTHPNYLTVKNITASTSSTTSTGSN